MTPDEEALESAPEGTHEEPQRAPKPRLSAGKLADVFRDRGAHEHVLLVQQALAEETGLDYSPGPSEAGPRTRRHYARWQEQCGVTPADGVPDKDSLKALGDRHGWTTTK